MTSIPMTETITLQAEPANKLRKAIIHLCGLSPDYAAWLEVAFWRLSQTENGQHWNLTTATRGQLGDILVGLFGQMPRSRAQAMAFFEWYDRMLIYTQPFGLRGDQNPESPPGPRLQDYEQTLHSVTYNTRYCRTQSRSVGLGTPGLACWRVPGVGGESRLSTAAEEVGDFDLYECIDMSRVDMETSGLSRHCPVEQGSDLRVTVDSVVSAYLEVLRTPVLVGEEQVFLLVTPVEASMIECF